MPLNEKTMTRNANRFRQLPTGDVELLRTETTATVVVDTRGRTTETVTLTAAQAAKIHKLLTMPGDPIPEYRGTREFFLAGNTPTEPGESVYPVLTAGANNIVLQAADGDEVMLTPPEIEAMAETLDDWGFTVSEGDTGRSIVSFPAMLTLEDGISEPLLHEDYDEVLEHYHRPVGYWSPSQGEYMVEHR